MIYIIIGMIILLVFFVGIVLLISQGIHNVYYVKYRLGEMHTKRKKIKGNYVDIHLNGTDVHVEIGKENWNYECNNEKKDVKFDEIINIDNMNFTIAREQKRGSYLKTATIILFMFVFFILLMLTGITISRDNVFGPDENQTTEQRNSDIEQIESEKEVRETETISETSIDETETEEKGLHEYVLENEWSTKKILDVNWNNYTQDADLRRSIFQDGIESEMGVNVSYYQGKIDWDKVKKFGIDFAIVRIGYRGIESGELSMDSKYTEYMDGATESGIKLGTYIYSQAISKEEMDEEIEFCLYAMKKYNITYPVGIQLDRADGMRTSQLTDNEYIDLIKYFCIRMSENGYTPMVFNSLDWFYELPDGALDGYLKWIYSATSKLDEEAADCVIWQYREYAYVNGISKKVSINLSGVPFME